MGHIRGWGQETAMASRAPEQFVLHVRFQDRDDGGLRAFCDNVPNFFLSHSDREKVLADVEPALQTILSAMYGLQMRVTRLPEMEEALDHQMVIAATYQQGSYLGAVEAH